MITNRKASNDRMNQVAIPMANVVIDRQHRVAIVRKIRMVPAMQVPILNDNEN